MDNINVEATSNTPLADFNQNGILKLEGRSFPENASEFYDPLVDFITDLNTPYVSFDIYLEYINTASSKKLFFLLNALDKNENCKSVQVNWYYEEGDDDSVETAEIYENSLKRIRFTYNEVAEVDC